MCHNYYGLSAPSGENAVFEFERGLLERQGHEVRQFVRYSDEIRGRGLVGLAWGAISTPWNPFSANDVRRAVKEFGPQVVHVHNTFPLISPSVFSAIVGSAASVLSLHNYRLFCAAAIPLRAGRPCTECLDERSVLPALKYGCYRGSRVATLPLATGIALHRLLGTWQKHVDAFIVLTEFQRDVVIAAGLPAGRVWVKPNGFPGAPITVPWAKREERVVFAGRLTNEKGVVFLIDAWGAWGAGAPELRILGEGPLRAGLEKRARAVGARVTFLGQVTPSDAEGEIARAMLVVVPSICFEGFPMVLREACAFGTPAAVSDVGPLSQIVLQGKTGVLFRPSDAGSILRAVRSLWAARGRMRLMSEGARQEYERKYAEDANYAALIKVYESAISVRSETARSKTDPL